ncbi:MAG: hypothetical protein IRY94_07270 [Rhodospirillaceae bacterium]|nr:hypothetical protein [Rhodospirillaceae bacterium]
MDGTAPTVAEVVERLNAVLSGDAARAEVAEWAAAWVARPEAVTDPRLWQLLRLSASLALTSPGADGRTPFLHSDADIRDWIESAGGA